MYLEQLWVKDSERAVSVQNFPSIEMSLNNSLHLAPLGPFKNSWEINISKETDNYRASVWYSILTLSQGNFTSERLGDLPVTCHNVGQQSWCSNMAPSDSKAHFLTLPLSVNLNLLYKAWQAHLGPPCLHLLRHFQLPNKHMDYPHSKN